MSGATLEQGAHLLQIVKEKAPPVEQLQDVIRSGLFADLLDANVREVNRDEYRKVLGLKPLRPSLLELVTTVSIPSLSAFCADDYCKVDTSSKAKISIAYLWPDFMRWFGGKTERPATEGELAVSTLTRNSLDAPILEEIGKEKRETTLSRFFHLLSLQGHGEAGVLLTNGWANIFYIRDKSGTLRAVGARWYADDRGWRLGADSTDNPGGWREGRRVFSRK